MRNNSIYKTCLILNTQWFCFHLIFPFLPQFCWHLVKTNLFIVYFQLYNTFTNPSKWWSLLTNFWNVYFCICTIFYKHLLINNIFNLVFFNTLITLSLINLSDPMWRPFFPSEIIWRDHSKLLSDVKAREWFDSWK